MPRLRQLLDSGAWGSMRSTVPPWTPTAWATLVTGKNPGKHGVFGMLWRRPGTYQFAPTSGKLRTGTPFWKRLNACGIKVGLVNIPFTYPPDPMDGFVVAGFGSPETASDVTYPPELTTFIEQRWGKYEPVVDARFLQTAQPDDILAKEKAHQRLQVEIATDLADRYQVDVLVINLMLTDHANHKMPRMEQVWDAYRQADKDLAELIDAYRPDNVMLISDHGSSRLKGDFLLNAWLRDQGYYVQMENDASGRSAALNWILMRWLRRIRGWKGLGELIVRVSIRETLFKLPRRMRDDFWRRLEKDIPFASEHVLLSHLPDYKRTQVFPGSAFAGLLYLNVIGRETTGVVPPEDRQRLAAEIAGKLREIKEPDTGRPLFANVYTAEELYTGPATANAPDLILDSYGMDWNVRSGKHTLSDGPTRDRYFVTSDNGRDFGWHSSEGIFVFAGVDFTPGQVSGGGDLVDVPATLLHLYDVPVPEDYDGRVLTELVAAEFAGRPIETQPGDDLEPETMRESLTEDEAAEVLSHLRALGYVD